MSTPLSVENLAFSYGRAKVFEGLSLRVGAGEIVTIIGPNGAGKSTLLNVIARSLRPRQGKVILGETKISSMRQSQVVKAGCVLVPEGRQVFSSLSVSDNLQLGAYTRRRDRLMKKAQAEVFAYFPRLEERKNQLAGTLSGGEQQMLAIGRAYMSRPSVMLLDEPSLGLSPQMSKQVMTVLRRLREETELTVVLVEQNANAALNLADRGYLLNRGQIVLEGSAAELKADPTVKHIYLGGAADEPTAEDGKAGGTKIAGTGEARHTGPSTDDHDPSPR